MLEDGKCGIGEFADEVHGSVDVKKIVVGNLLAVQLGEQVFKVAEEIAFLMRILAITHGLGSVDSDAKCRGTVSFIEIVEYRAVIARAYGKCFFGKPAALVKCGFRSIFTEEIGERSILVLGCDNNHIFIVFSGCADQRDAAYVNLFNYCFMACA